MENEQSKEFTRMIRPILFTLLLASSFAAIGIRAQTAADGRLPTFEVASVKRNTSGSISVNHSIVAGRYMGTNLSVADMLAVIYARCPALASPAGRLG